MPDVYAKGQPHVPVADIGGHYVGMHAPERPEVFKPEKLWWRGDEYAALQAEVAKAIRQRDAVETELVALHDSSRKVAEGFCTAEANYLRRVAALEHARELSAQASATMRDESIAKSGQIKELEERIHVLKGQVLDLTAAGQRRPPKRARRPEANGG